MEGIARLKRLKPEHFIDLVKMHLSLCIDSSFDEFSVTDTQYSSSKKLNFGPFKTKKCKSFRQAIAKDLFCECLTEEGVCRLYLLVQYLHREQNIKQEGLFRKSGSITRQQELRHKLSKGELVNLDNGDYTAHDCATVLKNILADLPEPLLLDSCYHYYLRIGHMKMNDNIDLDKQITAIQLLLLLLPSQNYMLLKDLLLLLHNVQMHQSQNRMDSRNLATLIAPHILCPRKLPAVALQFESEIITQAVQIMIENGPALFCPPHNLLTDVKLYWDRKKNECEETKENEPIITTVTFVDRQKSAEENEKCPTAIALAQLYAHVQSLPPSGRRDHLLKHICRHNKEHRPSTPLTCVSSSNTRTSLSNNIKKYLKKNKRTSQLRKDSNNQRCISITPSMCGPLIDQLELTPIKSELQSASDCMTNGLASTPYENTKADGISPLDEDSPLSNTLRQLPSHYKESFLTPCSRMPFACPSSDSSSLKSYSSCDSFSVVTQLSFGSESKTTDDEHTILGHSILSDTLHINLSMENLSSRTEEELDGQPTLELSDCNMSSQSIDSLAPYLNDTPENSLLMFLNGEFPDQSYSPSNTNGEENNENVNDDNLSQCENFETKIVFETRM